MCATCSERDKLRAEIERLKETNRSNQILATKHFERAETAERELSLRSDHRAKLADMGPKLERAERELDEARASERLTTPDVAAALYVFAAWLTTREEPITLGSGFDAAPAAEAVGDFCAHNRIRDPDMAAAHYRHPPASAREGEGNDASS